MNKVLYLNALPKLYNNNKIHEIEIISFLHHIKHL